MMSRLFLAILLLSSHTFVLRAAIVQHTPGTPVVFTNDACCPLCVPDENNPNPMGCGCGCGEAQQDERVPSSPDDVPGILSVERVIPHGSSSLIRVASTVQSVSTLNASVFDDASGHSDTNRFLARVGVWLN